MSMIPILPPASRERVPHAPLPDFQGNGSVHEARHTAPRSMDKARRCELIDGQAHMYMYCYSVLPRGA